jgi:hypothetical protein
MYATHYQLRWTTPTLRFLAVFYASLWVVLAVAKPDWTVWGPVGGFLLLVLLVANVLAPRYGVYEGAKGIAVRRYFSKWSADWTELAGFEHQRIGTHDFAYARLNDGSRRVLSGVLQGQRVVWNGGETRDIVGLLNERRAVHRESAETPGAKAEPS